MLQRQGQGKEDGGSPYALICQEDQDSFVSILDDHLLVIGIDNPFRVQYIVLRRICMDAVSYSDLRQNLKTYMDKVFYDHEPLIITRKNNENLVLVSIDEYNSLIETNYLLSNENNSEHLRKSIEQYKTGKLKKKELIENE